MPSPRPHASGWRVALVSHADGGVGRATTLLLAERGWRVLACGTDGGAMADLPRETSSGGWLEVEAIDLSSRSSCELAIERCLSTFGQLDAVVCSGSAPHYDPVETVDEGALQALFDANVFGPLRLFQLALPHMRPRRTGALLVVSSAVGRVALPMSGAYAASHHALEGLCEALRLEVAQFGVQVVMVEPGLLRERLVQATGQGGDPGGVRALVRRLGDNSPYLQAAKALLDLGEELRHRAATPQDVAEVVSRALAQERPKAHYSVSRGTAALVWARRLLPERFVDSRLRRAMGLEQAVANEPS